MTTVTESPACPLKPYSRAKLVPRCGAAQVAVVRESLTWASSVTRRTRHGCTANSTGSHAGLFFAFSADTTTVSRYTPVGSPAGLNASRSVAGAVPLVAPTNAGHDLALVALRQQVEQSLYRLNS